MSEGGSSVKRGRGLMLNSDFPRALRPVTAVYKSLRLFVPAACVLAVIYPLVGGRPGPGFFVLPLLFAIQVVMNVGIALAVSTYEVLVPDGSDLVQWLTRLLFFATPVIYPVALLPPVAKAILQFSRCSRSSPRTRRSSAAGRPAPPWWSRGRLGWRPPGDRRSRFSGTSESSRSICEDCEPSQVARRDCTSGRRPRRQWRRAGRRSRTERRGGTGRTGRRCRSPQPSAGLPDGQRAPRRPGGGHGRRDQGGGWSSSRSS